MTIQELWWAFTGRPEKAAEKLNGGLRFERLSNDEVKRLEALDWTTTDSVAVLQKRAESVAAHANGLRVVKPDISTLDDTSTEGGGADGETRGE